MEPFIRQRRNLILCACLVLFINLTGAQLKQINFLGNSVEIRNPASMPWLLGIVLSYFFIRYLQLAHEIKDKGFKSRFLEKAKAYLSKYVLKREYDRDGSRLPQCYKFREMMIADFNMFDGSLEWNNAFMSIEPKSSGPVIDLHDLHVSNRELILPFIRSAAYILFRTSLVTEFVLPVLLAVAAFASYSPGVASVWKAMVGSL